jgi:hypothetical protein
VSQVFSIAERGRDLFAAVQRLDLEGIVAKRKADPYEAGVTWYKIKNQAFTQMEGRGEPFDDPAWLFEPKYDGYLARRLQVFQIGCGLCPLCCCGRASSRWIPGSTGLNNGGLDAHRAIAMASIQCRLAIMWVCTRTGSVR